MPTDEKFIEFLWKINKHCESYGLSCSGCKFYVNDDCQISCLADELKETPMAWDMKEIERIIRL